MNPPPAVSMWMLVPTGRSRKHTEKRVNEVLAYFEVLQLPGTLAPEQTCLNVVPALTFKRCRVSSRVQEAIVFEVISNACDGKALCLKYRINRFLWLAASITIYVTQFGWYMCTERASELQVYSYNCEQSISSTRV